MLELCLRFEWKQAEGVARRYVDLADGRDRTEYVIGLLYRMRAQRVTRLADLESGSVECARCAGISLHNLMLFFKHQGTPGWKLLGTPTRLVYDRGLRLAPEDVSLAIVRAGLDFDVGEASSGFTAPVDAGALANGDVINMAYYHAARGDRTALFAWLARAMQRDPEHTREWAADSDDLDAYRGDAGVMGLLTRP